MPRRHRLSVMLIVCDEADRLEPCLQSVAGWADEIVVLDSGSRDASVDIAKRYTPKVFVTDWPGYGAQRQRALQYISGDYVLSLDADERVTPELRAEIDSVLSAETPACGSWQVRWRFWFLGAPLQHGRFEAPQTRLFQREGLSWPPVQVHEAPHLPPGPVGQLSARLEHHAFRDLRHAFVKHSDYAWLLANEKYAAGKRCSLALAFGRGLLEWIDQYLLRGLIVEGGRGLLLATLLAYYAFMKYACLWSLQKSGAAIDPAFAPQLRKRRT
jgi:glycosyltransferase involved in cell wall biosynthesis